MNIAICEDDKADAAKIYAILERYMGQHGYTGELSVFTCGEELLASFSIGVYDIIFMDIYMGGMNGIDAAKKIRDIDPTCALIFITSSRDHSLESYSVRGNAYVIKPILEDDMQSALFTCREVFLRNARYIEIRVDRADIKIPLIKLYFIEIYKNTAHFHTVAGEYKTRMTLDEVEQQIGGKPFYRCHQSYLINTNHVIKLDGDDAVMQNGVRVPIRKNGRDEMRRDLAALLNARMFEV